VFWGRNDPYVTGEFGERLAKRTGARLLLFDDSGHWWPVTKPREVAGALESLWSSVG
jgi:pimeloyl-ACP methyl ester carboxylesterase